MQLNRLIPALLLALSIGLVGCNLFRSSNQTQSTIADMGVEEDANTPDLIDGEDGGLTDTGVTSTDAGLSIPDFAREEYETEDPVVAPRTRVTNDLIALWLFNQGSGEIIEDVSGVEPAVDLTLEGNVSWNAAVGSMTFRNARAVSVSPTKVYDRWLESERMTVEFWARSTNDAQTGPTRVLTLSKDSSNRNLTIGFDRSEMHVRMRGVRTSLNEQLANGEPFVQFQDVLDLAVHHWVVTYDGWKIRLYRDGELVDTESRPTPLDTWDRSYPLAVGDEFETSRNLEAELFLIALYDRALTADEISVNFEAGLSVDAEDASVPPELR